MLDLFEHPFFDDDDHKGEDDVNEAESQGNDQTLEPVDPGA